MCRHNIFRDLEWFRNTESFSICGQGKNIRRRYPVVDNPRLIDRAGHGQDGRRPSFWSYAP
jgi:hypothetical protein